MLVHRLQLWPNVAPTKGLLCWGNHVELYARCYWLCHSRDFVDIQRVWRKWYIYSNGRTVTLFSTSNSHHPIICLIEQKKNYIWAIYFVLVINNTAMGRQKAAFSHFTNEKIVPFEFQGEIFSGSMYGDDKWRAVSLTYSRCVLSQLASNSIFRPSKSFITSTAIITNSAMIIGWQG